jgi:hypothetical protein
MNERKKERKKEKKERKKLPSKILNSSPTFAFRNGLNSSFPKLTKFKSGFSCQGQKIDLKFGTSRACTGLIWPRTGTSDGLCECCNVVSASIKHRKFIHQLRKYYISRKKLLSMLIVQTTRYTSLYVVSTVHSSQFSDKLRLLLLQQF